MPQFEPITPAKAPPRQGTLWRLAGLAQTLLLLSPNAPQRPLRHIELLSRPWGLLSCRNNDDYDSILVG